MYVVFGDEFNSLHKDSFLKAYATLLQQIDITIIFNIATAFLPFLRKLPFPRVLKVSAARKLTVELVTKLVRARKEKATAGKDIFSFMIAPNQKVKEGLTEMELVDQCITLLLAGHETTSTAVLPNPSFAL
jgi:cytochrome P450